MKNGRWQVLILGCVVALVFYPPWFGLSVALAEQFRIVKGKKDPVCELCKQNLETLHPGSVRCGREYAPQFSSLKSVEWANLDLMMHKDLVRKIERFANYRDQYATEGTVSGRTDAEFEETLRDYMRRGTSVLSRAVADINNDGQTEVILRLAGGKCSSRGYAQQLFVATSDLSALDVEKTDLLSGWGWGTSVEIFLYKNATYVDVWIEFENDRQLTIYKHSDGKAKELCVLKYRKDVEAIKPGQ